MINTVSCGILFEISQIATLLTLNFFRTNNFTRRLILENEKSGQTNEGRSQEMSGE